MNAGGGHCCNLLWGGALGRSSAAFCHESPASTKNLQIIPQRLRLLYIAGMKLRNYVLFCITSTKMYPAVCGRTCTDLLDIYRYVLFHIKVSGHDSTRISYISSNYSDLTPNCHPKRQPRFRQIPLHQGNLGW